jgi:hypothetical protein
VTEAGDIEETFLGFIKLDSGKAKYLAEKVVELLGQYGIDLDKMRGQVSLYFVEFLISSFKFQ